MLVGGVVVDDGVDFAANRQRAVDFVEETDELSVPVALLVARDHRAVEDVQCPRTASSFRERL